MFSDPYLGVRDNPTDTQTTASYSLLPNAGANGSVRVIQGAAAGTPKILRINHSVVGKGANARDRRVVSLECYPLVSGIEDIARPARVYTVFDIPQKDMTSPQIVDLWRYHVGLVRGKGGLVNYGDPAYFLTPFLQGQA